MHAEAQRKLEEARSEAEHRTRVADAEIARARAKEDHAIRELRNEKASLEQVRSRVAELNAQVQNLERQLKAADIRADELANKLAQERNRVLQLKFRETMSVDHGQFGLARQNMPRAEGDTGGVQGVHARQERQQIKRLVSHLKSRLSTDLERWRKDGCAAEGR